MRTARTGGRGFMKNAIFLFLVVSIFLSACGESPRPNTNAPNANSATSTVNAENPIKVQTPTPEATTNNAPTLTPVYKAYCAAFVKKDEAAVRKAYSKDTVAFFEKSMKEDGIKSLIEFLSDDGISNEVCEVRNEVITGDKATAIITTKGYPNGFPVLFEKEDGEWKLTNKRPEGALK